jgi:hypothetical protein
LGKWWKRVALVEGSGIDDDDDGDFKTGATM